MNENIKNEHHVSFENIIRITYPVILSMFTLNIMVFVDRAFVAKYSLTQFAATMPASNLATTVASIFIGIVGFLSALVSQYYGAQKYKECASSMWQGVYISIFFSLLLLIISLVASNIFQVMGHTGELLKYERQYFNLLVLSSCVQLFSTAFSSLYRGIGDTKTTMFVGILANIFNVLLDWVLIYGKLGFPEMGGVFGSGVATLISSIIGVMTYISLLNKNDFKKKYKVFTNLKLDKSLMYKLLRFGFPAGIQSFVGTGYFSLLLLIIGKTGEFNLSSANIAFTIEGVSIFPVWGLGTAVSIIAGQERGAGRIDNVIKVVKKGILIGLCFNLIIIVLYNFFPHLLISIFNSGKDKTLVPHKHRDI
ncbi:hypothetical protein SY88_14245 [Clostridiales bacterium PH28_bin88]|nr:hypothetical protein SY88_14245 [Clostridiales bacterium PH28_bin88]